MKKIIVIGGGASGLTASIIAAQNGCAVTIIEKNATLGKKILVTGNGRCNYFNEDFNIDHFNSENKKLLEMIINDENKIKVKSFFSKLGIVSKIKDGYYYPYSNQAVSIQNSLITEVKNNKIKTILNTTVLNVRYENDFYTIETDNGNYQADAIVLATGSKALYNTEKEEIGYKILKNLGHKIVPVLPGLVQLKGNESYFKEWNGIRCECKMDLYDGNEIVKSEVGELQLTNYGISGICTLQISNQAVKMMSNNKNPYIKINFLNFLNINTKERFIEYFNKRSNNLQNHTISELFDTILNYKLTNILLKLSKIDLNKKYSELNDNELNNLINNTIDFKFEITGYNSFKESQICLGGISLEDINISKMESKKVKNLYICGEILDVAGDCGGYNLGFAWLSGILVGESLKND